MKRVTRPGGKVAACVWDMTGGMTMIRAYWEAAREADPDAPAETERFGGKPGQLADLWRAAGLRDVEDDVAPRVHALPGFRRALAVVPPRRGADRRARRVARGREARRRSRALHRRIGSPDGPFELTASAWYAVGTV